MVGSAEPVLMIKSWLADWQPYAEGNLFVIGASQVGKSTLAKKLEDVGLGIQKSASGWIKEEFKSEDFVDYSSMIKSITEESKVRLMKDPDSCVKWIKQGFNCAGGGLIIEGVRNPMDFMKLFDMSKDKVIFVSRSDLQPCTDFEKGIHVIKSYVDWIEDVFGIEVALEIEL